MPKCCVVLTTHVESVTGDEESSVKQCVKIFGKNREIYLVVPEGLNIDWWKSFGVFKPIFMPKENFASYRDYNHLCCKTEFYENFKDYDYILMYQTDCWVFKDRLDEFMSLGYDWYGAAWYTNVVGNGGLSLRKVSTMIDVTKKYPYTGENEDVWFCQRHKNDIRACDLKTACNFSLECPRTEHYKLLNGLPMGVHGKTNHYLWDEHFYKHIKLIIGGW